MCVVDIVYGLSYGVLLTDQVDAYSPRDAAAQLSLSLVFASFALGWLVGVIQAPTESDKLSASNKLINTYWLAIALAWGALFPLYGRVSSYQLLLADISSIAKLALVFAAVITLYLAYATGKALGNATRALSSAGYSVVGQVITLGTAGGFFLVGYMLIAAEYASIYALIWKHDNLAFAGEGLSKSPSWLDFFYFSVITIATVGYGDIAPHSKMARVATISEVMIGMTWVTLLVSATISKLSTRGQPPNPGSKSDA